MNELQMVVLSGGLLWVSGFLFGCYAQHLIDRRHDSS